MQSAKAQRLAASAESRQDSPSVEGAVGRTPTALDARHGAGQARGLRRLVADPRTGNKPPIIDARSSERVSGQVEGHGRLTTRDSAC